MIDSLISRVGEERGYILPVDGRGRGRGEREGTGQCMQSVGEANVH